MGKYVVTGANTGIGAAVRRQLQQDGHVVVSVDIAGEPDVLADLSTAQGRADALAALRPLTAGGIDGLVPCAGVGPHSESSPLIASLNFFGVLAIVDGLREQLRARQGSVVLISSNTIATVSAGDFVSRLLEADEAGAVGLAATMDGQSVYAQCKLALAYWMRRSTAALADAGIRINAVAPGYTRTPLTEAGLRNPQYGPLIDKFLQSIPLRREAQPDEIASVVCFLIRREASYVCGAVLYVDGGYDAAHRSDWC